MLEGQGSLGNNNKHLEYPNLQIKVTTEAVVAKCILTDTHSSTVLVEWGD